jgi:Flp pilus assembly pilin Flp
MRKIIAFVNDERAATAILAAGIAIVIIPAITGAGSKLKTTFTTIQTALK